MFAYLRCVVDKQIGYNILLHDKTLSAAGADCMIAAGYVLQQENRHPRRVASPMYLMVCWVGLDSMWR
jgi:hypothetical protein